MKRLLSILGSVTIIGMAGATVVACKSNKTSLSSIITVTNLGTIAMRNGQYPTLGELISAIKAKNPSASNLDGSNIRLYGEPSQTQARVMGIGSYTGTVFLNYTRGTTPVDKDLTNIISTTNLGAIVMANSNGPTSAELLQGIKSANSSANNLTTNDFTATTVTGTSATVTGANGYIGSVNLTYSRETNLVNIIPTKNLGAIVMANPTTGPTAAELLAGIKATNNPKAASLTTSDFSISGTASTTAATISGAGAYTGNVNLTYTAQTDITKIITTTTLGPITMAGATPTIDELLVGIKAANPKAASLTASNLALSGTPTATSGTVTGASPYTGSVTLSYSKASSFAKMIEPEFIFDLKN